MTARSLPGHTGAQGAGGGDPDAPTDPGYSPAPIIPDRDPTHTPIIPERDPTHSPILPEPEPEPLIDPVDGSVSLLDVYGPSLSAALGRALEGTSPQALWEAIETPAVDERDELLALTAIHDLHVAPVDEQRHRVAFQHHPAVASLKGQLEERFLARLDAWSSAAFAEADGGADASSTPTDPASTVAAVRALGARDQVPAVYEWLATVATDEQVRWYLSLEGGPDGTFDDLVALCQVGLAGEPKLELAVNYWDEMGTGVAALVHTELHAVAARTLRLHDFAPTDLPDEALRRSLLTTTLATNRLRQPELVGALGLTELQAGPRCRKVLSTLHRLGAPDAAARFYEEHAVADPRHGKAWLDRVVAPLAEDEWWATGIVRGARWRWWTNATFFDAAHRACAS